MAITDDDMLLRQAPTVATLSSLLQPLDTERDPKHLQDLFAHGLLRAASTGDVELLSWLAAPRSTHSLQSSPLNVIPSRVLPVRRGHRSHPPSVDRQGFVADPDANEGEMRVVNFDSPLFRDQHGTGPVVLAASSGHLEAVRLLLTYGADVDERDGEGWTSLLWAANLSNVSLLSFLLASGADVDARSAKGTSCDDFLIAFAPPGNIAFEQIDASEAAVVSATRNVDPGHEAVLGTEEHRVERDRKLIIDMILNAKKQSTSTSPTDTASEDDINLPSVARSPSRCPSPIPPAHSISPSKQGHQRFPSSTSFLSTNSPTPLMTPPRFNTLRGRRLLGAGERVQFAEAELKVRELSERRKRELVRVASVLQVDLDPLIGFPPASVTETAHSRASNEHSHPRSLMERRAKTKRQASSEAAALSNSPLASGSGYVELSALEKSLDDLDFDFTTIRPDEIQAKPIRAPWTVRLAPANFLFLASRYCARVQDADLLEGLISAAVDKIEDVVIKNSKKLTNLAFWLVNAQMLLYYFLSDATLRDWDEAGPYPALLTDLINEIYIFVIRDIERRIDLVLEPALLDYESIPTEPKMDDAQATGSWNFVKGLAQRGSMRGFPSETSMDASSSPFQSPSQSLGHGRSLSALFSAGAAEIGRRTSISRVASNAASSPRAPRPRPTSPTNSAGENKAVTTNQPSPQTVTALLTSALEVLQLYEVNPAIIVQLMSQVIFWLGSEVFNHILGLVSGPYPSGGQASLASLGAALRTPAQKSRERRRFLCRARATQIRLNLSSLDEWARRAGLPPSLVSTHLAPAQQLCSWLVALSSLSDFSALVATVQQLRALSPPQLARATQDYLYSRFDTKLDAECTEYLTLLQADWHQSTEKTPKQKPRSLDARFSGPGDEMLPLSEEERAVREAQLTVDALFEPGGTIDDFRPAWTALGRPGPAGEMVARPRSRAAIEAIQAAAPSGYDLETAALMLNSREMLPFVLPSSPDTLVVTPGDALGLGKGHFSGTGLVLPPSPSDSGVGAQTRSRPSSLIMPVDEDSELASALSGASSTGATSATSMFLQQGQGFSSGSGWQPIPCLPEGMVERVDRATRSGHRPRALAPRDLDLIAQLQTEFTSSEADETAEDFAANNSLMQEKPLPATPSVVS